jgi:hypothetical protein
MWITGKTLQIPKIVSGKKVFGGTFSFSNCHIKGLDNGRHRKDIYQRIFISYPISISYPFLEQDILRI